VTSLRGRLLVAAPSLADPNFARAVVLVLDHGPDGAVGIVLNRPSDAAVADPLPAWRDVVAEPRVLFVGGPVAGDTAIGLGAAATGSEDGGFDPLDVDVGVGTVDLSRDPSEVPLEELRVFCGYAGWSEGQLESELAEGSWVVAAVTPQDDVFGADPDELWARVLRRQPGRVAWLAGCPADVSSN